MSVRRIVMKHRKIYDKRMGLWDNWRFGIWRPFLCKVKGHKFTCYGITQGRDIPISKWLYICRYCVIMGDHSEPCGQCSNMCRKEEEDYGKEDSE